MAGFLLGAVAKMLWGRSASGGGAEAAVLQQAALALLEQRVHRGRAGAYRRERAARHAEQHLALTRELGILRTPTTLVLDAAGLEAARASGAPTREQVLKAIETLP